MISSFNVDILNSLTLTEWTVLRYLDSNKEEILNLSIQKIADNNFVSTTTIIRLCKKLGFTGFSELKFFIKDILQNSNELNKDLSYDKIVDDHLNNIVASINLFDKKKILEVVDLMTRAENIHFFGKGLTGSVVSYYSKILQTLGIKNFIYEDTHIAYIAAEKMTRKDLVFVASLSGNTHQAIRFSQISKSKKAKIISLTSNNPNQLAEIADIPLCFVGGQRKLKVEDTVSRTPAFFIFDIIIEVLIAKTSGILI